VELRLPIPGTGLLAADSELHASLEKLVLENGRLASKLREASEDAIDSGDWEDLRACHAWLYSSAHFRTPLGTASENVS
jgi:hypothetical protein